MATLTYQSADVLGSAFTMQAAAGGGDKVAPAEHGAVLVTNGGGSPITITVTVPGTTEYGQAEPDYTVSVGAGASKLIGPFDADLAGVDGLVSLAYSGVTSVTVAAISI